MSERPFTVRLFNTVEPVTTFYRDLIPYWEALGWAVEVFISCAEYRAGRETPWIGAHTKVHWTTAPGGGNGRAGKFLSMIAYMISAAAGSLFGPTVDRNLFLTQPPLFFLWGYVLKRLRGQAGYIVLMDLYPEVAIQAGLLKRDSAPAKLLRRLSHFGLRQADGVIVIGRTMRERVLEIGVSPERIHLIPNWADEEAIHPIRHANNRFRQDQGWQGKFVVLYSGNMGTAHYFDDLLEACRRMRSTESVIFAFIGQGRRRSEIEAFQQAHGLENMVLLPFQPQEKLAETLSAGNLQFVSLQSGYEGLVVPSKIYGILAAGLPTLYQGESRGEIALMLAEEDAGCVVGFGSAAEIERRILTYQGDPDLIARQSDHARELAEGPYSKQRACRRYTAVLGPVPAQTAS